MFVTMDWFSIPADRTYVELRCFPTQLQEPWEVSVATSP